MHDGFYQDLGRHIVALRKQKGWTQEALADHTEVGASYIARIETGNRRPTLEVLGQLASAFDVPLWHLLADRGDIDEERSWAQGTSELIALVSKLSARDVQLLLQLARRLLGAPAP